MSPLSPKLDMSLWELETNFSTSGIIPLLKWMLEEKPTQRPQTPEEIIEIIDYISSRKPDGNFPTAKDTEVQINASKGKHEQKIIPEGTTILPKENTSEPLKPDVKKALPPFISEKQGSNTTAFPWLKSFKISRRVPKILPIFFILLAAGTVLIIHIVQPKLDTVCDFDTDNKISCGEEILLGEQDQGSRTKKKGGAQAIARKNYREAIKLLTEDWNITKDPETLIMIENAKIAQITTPIRNIAINIPASNTPAPIATAMLKAVAFAQQEWNKNTENKWKLRLILVDDANDEGKAVKRTELLLKRGVHAAIGNYSSKVTLVTKKNYQENRTVLISGTSTAGSLTSLKQDTFFFRVCSTNEKSGSKVKSYLIKNNYKKIALFRNQGEPFSDSITKELERNVGTNNIVKYFDYKNNEPIDNQIKEAKALGAQAIVLFPGAYASDSSERKKSLSIIEKNNGDLPIIANEVVKDQTLLSLKTKQLQNLVITLPWHPSTSESNEIKPSPDWWGEKDQLDHRIVLNYDAIRIIIEAIDEIPVDNGNIVEIRQKIQKTLSSPEFKTKGYTGEISFEGSDRRELISSLIKPSCNGGNKCKGFEAVP
jgi:branched-chain amino acid transport system substrate-binding protein